MSEPKARLLAILETALVNSGSVAANFDVTPADRASTDNEQAEIEWAIEALTSGELCLSDASKPVPYSPYVDGRFVP